MRIALIGQPNCGKSTLFNQVAGYKAETGNFSGTTVKFTGSRVRVAGEVVEIVDLPGAYTLEVHSSAEREAAWYLRSNEVDVIINVVDATRLGLGLHIDGPCLQKDLETPVLPLVASKGSGVKPVFLKALEAGRKASNGK